MIVRSNKLSRAFGCEDPCDRGRDASMPPYQALVLKFKLISMELSDVFIFQTDLKMYGQYSWMAEAARGVEVVHHPRFDKVVDFQHKPDIHFPHRCTVEFYMQHSTSSPDPSPICTSRTLSKGL